jgi:hypothetical protein
LNSAQSTPSIKRASKDTITLEPLRKDQFQSPKASSSAILRLEIPRQRLAKDDIRSTLINSAPVIPA